VGLKTTWVMSTAEITVFLGLLAALVALAL
jgi:hypothetical protein